MSEQEVSCDFLVYTTQEHMFTFLKDLILQDILQGLILTAKGKLSNLCTTNHGLLLISPFLSFFFLSRERHNFLVNSWNYQQAWKKQYYYSIE